MPERPPTSWWPGFGAALAATCASVFVTSFLAGAFLKPHAFGA